MEAASSKTDKVNEAGRGRKKKRGGGYEIQWVQGITTERVAEEGCVCLLRRRPTSR